MYAYRLQFMAFKKLIRSATQFLKFFSTGRLRRISFLRKFVLPGISMLLIVFFPSFLFFFFFRVFLLFITVTRHCRLIVSDLCAFFRQPSFARDIVIYSSVFCDEWRCDCYRFIISMIFATDTEFRRGYTEILKRDLNFCLRVICLRILRFVEEKDVSRVPFGKRG